MGNALAVGVLVLLGLIAAQNAMAGTLGRWLSAKFLNVGAPDPYRATTAAAAGPPSMTVTVAGTSNPTAPYGSPLPGGQFVSPFGAPRDGGARLHQGIDLAAPLGTPVVAVADGIAVRVGDGGLLCGLRVAIAQGGGVETLYCHLSGFALVQGQAVRRGQTVGYVGATGNAATSGPHLHFEIRRNGVPVNPAPLTGY